MPRRELVLAAFNRRPEWQVTVQNTDCNGAAVADSSLFYWGEYETIDWQQVHAGEASILCMFATHSPEFPHSTQLTLLWLCSSGQQHACCYCFRKGLIRKAHLCHNTKKWAAKHPDGWLARSVPEAFIFELDDIDYIEEALCDVPEVFSFLL